MASFSGLGPMPGTDPHASAAVIYGESMEGRVHLPILAARGLGADSIGRTGALLVDLPLDRGPRSWQVADHLSAVSWRAKDFLERDIDACEQEWGHSVRCVRLPAVGPWTLAASVELANGHTMLTDRGALRYLAQSLAEGLLLHAKDIRARTDAQVEFLIQEPLLADVTLGNIAAPTTALGESGFLPAQGWAEVAGLLRQVVNDANRLGESRIYLQLPAVTGLSYQMVVESGVQAVSMPRRALRTSEQLDFASAIVGSGLTLELGAVSADDVTRADHSGRAIGPHPRSIAEDAAKLWDELGFSRQDFASNLTLSLAGGLDRCAHDEVSAVLASGREAAELINRAAGDLALDVH